MLLTDATAQCSMPSTHRTTRHVPQPEGWQCKAPADDGHRPLMHRMEGTAKELWDPIAEGQQPGLPVI